MRLHMLAVFLGLGLPPYAFGQDLTIAEPEGFLRVQVSEVSGVYSIIRKSPGSGAELEFQGKLGAITGLKVGSGVDRLGAYEALEWQAEPSASHYAIRLHSGRSSVFFTVRLSGGLAKEARFPVFIGVPNAQSRFSFRRQDFSPITQDLSGDAPWGFISGSGDSWILSPASRFMVSNCFQGPNGELGVGIEPQVKDPGAEVEFQAVLAFGPGINSAFENWGRALTDLSGKRALSADEVDADPLISRLGYWTDNRSSYWYNYDSKLGYEGTLTGIRDEFLAASLPLAYVQLDSWWYTKGGDPLALPPLLPSWKKSNYQHGIQLFEADPENFPQGLAGFETKLGLPLVTHSRWIDPQSPYASQFKLSRQAPIDPAYWEMIMARLQTGGVGTYEQDWMNEKTLPDLGNLSDGERFMDLMAESAQRHGLNLQYCMPLPRHFLQGSRYSNLHSIRTSGDGLTRDKWTQFLYGARLASSLGIRPWTDVFFSADRKHVLLAALSTGPLGVGDRLGSSGSPAQDYSPETCQTHLNCQTLNVQNLRAAIRADGVIVKPDTTLMPTDGSFSDLKTMVATAVTRRMPSEGSGRVDAVYLFAYARDGVPQTHFTLTPSVQGIPGPAYLYRHESGQGELIKAGGSIELEADTNGTYYVLVPYRASGFAIIGDPSLFVTFGRKRVRAEGDHQLEVEFARGESRVVIQGYAEIAPVQPKAINGAALSSQWDPASGVFHWTVGRPGAAPDVGTYIARIQF